MNEDTSSNKSSHYVPENSNISAIAVDNVSCSHSTGDIQSESFSNAGDKKSFHITSVTMQHNSSDGNGDESTDESRTEELSDRIDVSAVNVHREITEYPENIIRKDDILYKVTSIGSAPIIPTSAQYGIAVVSNPNAELADNVNKFVSNNKLTDSVHRSECFQNGALESNGASITSKEFNAKNERFKVVKIESNEPFRRGRWVCMDFLDQSMDQAKKATVNENNEKKQKDVGKEVPAEVLVNGTMNLENIEPTQAIDVAASHLNGEFSNSISPHQSFSAPFVSPVMQQQHIQSQSLVTIPSSQPSGGHGSYGHAQNLLQGDIQHLQQSSQQHTMHLQQQPQSFQVQHAQGSIPQNMQHIQPQQSPVVMQQQPFQPMLPHTNVNPVSQQLANQHCIPQLPQQSNTNLNSESLFQQNAQILQSANQSFQNQQSLQHSLQQVPVQQQQQQVYPPLSQSSSHSMIHPSVQQLSSQHHSSQQLNQATVQPICAQVPTSQPSSQQPIAQISGQPQPPIQNTVQFLPPQPVIPQTASPPVLSQLLPQQQAQPLQSQVSVASQQVQQTGQQMTTHQHMSQQPQMSIQPQQLVPQSQQQIQQHTHNQTLIQSAPQQQQHTQTSLLPSQISGAQSMQQTNVAQHPTAAFQNPQQSQMLQQSCVQQVTSMPQQQQQQQQQQHSTPLSSQNVYQHDVGVLPNLSQNDVVMSKQFSVPQSQPPLQSMPPSSSQHPLQQQAYPVPAASSHYINASNIGLVSTAMSSQQQAHQQYYSPQGPQSVQSMPPPSSCSVASQDIQHLCQHQNPVMNIVTQPPLISSVVGSQNIQQSAPPTIHSNPQHSAPQSLGSHQGQHSYAAHTQAMYQPPPQQQQQQNGQCCVSIQTQTKNPISQAGSTAGTLPVQHYSVPLSVGGSVTATYPISMVAPVHSSAIQQQNYVSNIPAAVTLQMYSIGGQGSSNVPSCADAFSADLQLQEQVAEVVKSEELPSQRSNDDNESIAGESNTVAIDNKIEQAMDLVKSHLMFAVREEVEVLKEKISELMDRINQLEMENSILKTNATPETLAQLPAYPSSGAIAAAMSSSSVTVTSSNARTPSSSLSNQPS